MELAIRESEAMSLRWIVAVVPRTRVAVVVGLAVAVARAAQLPPAVNPSRPRR